MSQIIHSDLNSILIEGTIKELDTNNLIFRLDSVRRTPLQNTPDAFLVERHLFPVIMSTDIPQYNFNDGDKVRVVGYLSLQPLSAGPEKGPWADVMVIVATFMDKIKA